MFSCRVVNAIYIYILTRLYYGLTEYHDAFGSYELVDLHREINTLECVVWLSDPRRERKPRVSQRWYRDKIT